MRTNIISILLVGALVATSCSDKENNMDVLSNFEKTIGRIDPQQTWQTSTIGEVTVNVPKEGTITVYCEDESSRVVLTCAKVTTGAKTLRFDIPAHLTTEVEIYDLDENEEPYVSGTVSREIMVEYKVEGIATTKRISFQEANEGINVSFNSSNEAKTRAVRKAAGTQAVNETPNKAALTGVSEATIYGYSTFPGDILKDLSIALPENKEAKNQIHDFEMISNGKFLVSMFYGITGNTDRTVGYYYYNNNTPSDIIYVPFCNALKYDFYYDNQDYTQSDPLSKTQIKKGGQWYDVNYDHYDRSTGYSSNKPLKSVHSGDNTYVIADEYEKNKSSIEEVRGITFVVDVPKGTTFGFYCGGKDSKFSNGKDDFYNHTQTSFNKKFGNVTKFTAAIRVYNGYRFIGLEDTFNPSASQADCNDVTFAIVPGGNMPDIRLPYVIDNVTGKYYNGDGTLTDTPKKDILTDGVYTEEKVATTDEEYAQLAIGKTIWTIAFEDTGVLGDYDLNDVVIQVVPIQEVNKAQVKICAAGGTQDCDLYYNGQYLGEVHDLLGVNRGTIINTGAKTQVPFKVVAYVDWPEEYTMGQHSPYFYIISNGITTKTPSTPGQTPTALAVAYDWKWPMEKTTVSTSYQQFGDWGSNYDNKNYSNWYTQPTSGKVTTRE